MEKDKVQNENPYEMKFDVGTIKHLGLQMYSTLPPVIGELVANAWDANATKVEITIPETPIDEAVSEIIIRDNGIGMSDKDVRNKYLIIGRDRRSDEKTDVMPGKNGRQIMGRKGIGKFSAFGIAKEIEIESVKDGEISRLIINYDRLLEKGDDRVIKLPQLMPTGHVTRGTKITLRYIIKFNNRRISIRTIQRGLARRFSVIGAKDKFEVMINRTPISTEDQDLKRLLRKDINGIPYLWDYDDVEIQQNTGWTISGWIGALEKPTPSIDGVDRGIVLMARGKLVQEPFVFNTNVGQQYALSYLIGELHVDFVDQAEDMISTNRNALVWDTEPNTALLEWGQNEVNKIARAWSDKRSEDNEQQLLRNPLYLEFRDQAEEIGNKRALKIADKLVRQTVQKNPIAETEDQEPLIKLCLDFLEFDAFWEITEDLTESDFEDTENLLNLFKEWQIVEAKEMARVTSGRIETIEKLQNLIEKNVLEVPTLHNFLKEFPWVIDPRWTLVDDEVTYSELLRKEFPDDNEKPEKNKRIDFLCIRETTHLVVVEIKRPELKVSREELNQIEEYVIFMRDYIQKTSDPNYKYEAVTGYLLCGDLVDRPYVRERRKNLESSQIYIRRYVDLLSMVQQAHMEFLKRYNELRAAKQRAETHSHS